MDDLSTIVVAAMAQAAMAGLCRDGQLEIGVQAAREAGSDLAPHELARWVEALHHRVGTGSTR